MYKLLLALLLFLLPRLALAQCANGLLQNCPPAVSPQPTDLIYGWQFGQTPHSRSFAFAQFAANILGSNNTWTGTNTFNGTFGGSGVTGLLASPPAIGGTSAAAGSFTNLSSSGTVSGTGFSNYLASPPAIGGTSAAAGSFTTLTAGGKTIALNASGTFYPGHSLIGVQTFCNAASGCTTNSCGSGCTYTADGGTNQVVVEVQAPGGAGGGCASTSASQSCVTGGGASGSYAEDLITSGFSGVTVTVGSPGAAATAGNNSGGSGATTSFGSAVSCAGGGGAPGSAAAAFSSYQLNGAGGNAPSACTVSSGTTLKSVGGTGGGLGSVWSINTNGQYSGVGGSAPDGIGGIPAFTSTTTTGTSGTGYGAGSSGSASIASQSASASKAGQPGIVIVYEFN